MAESLITKSPNEDALDMQLGAMQLGAMQLGAIQLGGMQLGAMQLGAMHIDTNMHCSIEDTKNTVERKLIEVEDTVVHIPIVDNIQHDTLITEANVCFVLCYKALNQHYN